MYLVTHMRDFVEIVYALQNQKDPVEEYVNTYVLKLSGDNSAEVSIEEIILQEEIRKYSMSFATRGSRYYVAKRKKARLMTMLLHIIGRGGWQRGRSGTCFLLLKAVSGE